MSTSFHDLRLAARGLVRRPVFALLAVASLGVGIGASATLYRLAAELLLRPLPVERPEELMAISTGRRAVSGSWYVSYMNWVDLAEQSRSFAALGAYDDAPMSVSLGGEAFLAPGQLVSRHYFETLGVRPALGRLLGADDDRAIGAHPVVVVSDRFWRLHLGADPAVLGRTLRLNGHDFSVVGVAPAALRGLTVTTAPELWVPMAMYRQIHSDLGYDLYQGNRRALMLQIVGRRQPGVSPAAATAEVAAIGERLARDFPDDNSDRTLHAEPLDAARVPAYLRTQLGGATGLLTGVVALLLLMVCVNVANLQLSRATERRGEIALRLALGASRPRLLAQLLTESLVVAGLGAGAGVALAALGRPLLLARFAEMPIPLKEPQLTLDAATLGFAAAVAVAAALAFGLAPALHALRVDLVDSLRGLRGVAGETRRIAPRHLLVVAQVAISVVLLFASGVFLQSLARAQAIDPGFEPRRLLTLALDLGVAGYSPEEGEAFHRRLIERAEAEPGVERAVLAQAGPLDSGWQRTLNLPGEDDADRHRLVGTNVVGPGYFETLGIALARGRGFDDADRRRPDVTVVNEALAAELWPGEEAIGKTIRLRSSRTDYTLEVVGVARDVDYEALGQEPSPYAYIPAAREPRPDLRLVVRTAGDPAPLLEPLGRLVRELDPELAIVSRSTVGDRLATHLWSTRAASLALAAFGAIALALAAMGLYGVLSHAVTARRREIGIRVAVGASRGQLLQILFGRSLALVAVGLATGLALAMTTVGFLRSILYVEPFDPWSGAVTVLLLLTVAALATAAPASRALRVDPASALRHD